MGKKIDTAIDDTKGVQVNEILGGVLGNCLVGDALILFLEEGGEGWPVPSTVLISCEPNGYHRSVREWLTDSVKMEMTSLFGL